MNASELETWARQHLVTAIETRRSVEEFNPICVVTTGTEDMLYLLLIPKPEVPAAVAACVRKHRAQAVAMVMDTWVATQATPPPYDQPVREMPGRSDALVVMAKSPEAACLVMARYVEVDGELCVEDPEVSGGEWESRFFDRITWPEGTR